MNHREEQIADGDFNAENGMTEGTLKELEERLFSRDNVPADTAKQKKYVALFQARTIVAQLGFAKEKAMARRQLTRMKKLGLNAL